MARNNTSIGVGVTITLLGILLLATFVLTIVFYGQKQRAQEELAVATTTTREIYRAGEENQEPMSTLLAEAKRGRQSLITYLNDQRETAMRHLTGRRDAGADDLTALSERLQNSGSSSLVRLLNNREQSIAELERRVADAEDAKQTAEDDLQAEVDRIARIESDRDAAVAALNEEVGRYKSELDTYRSMVTDTIGSNNERVETIRANAADTEAMLRDRIAEINEQMLIQKDQIQTLQGDRSRDALKPKAEYALVDARVVAIDAPQQEVFIDIGKANRVVLGMTFEVYASAASITPNAQGDYPRGKATVEVIRIDEGSSVGRIIRENRGNPIIVGDTLANAVYDPNKEYTFIVFGNFDANRDGVATPQERNAITSLISNWGGIINDELVGSVDFLVLGQRPILPPPPAADAPLSLIQDYLRKQTNTQEYDRLFEIAQQTSIPVLNENRLYTLLGRHGAIR